MRTQDCNLAIIKQGFQELATCRKPLLHQLFTGKPLCIAEDDVALKRINGAILVMQGTSISSEFIHQDIQYSSAIA